MKIFLYILLVFVAKPIYAENIFHAIAWKNMDRINFYIKQDGLETIDHSGATPLFSAIATGDIKLVKLFVDQGANVNHISDYRWTPYMLATDIGNMSILKYLFGSGEIRNIDYTNSNGETAYMRAAMNGHTAIMQYLTKNANVKTGLKQSRGYNELILAINNNEAPTVKYIMKNYPTLINEPDNEGLTPVTHAFVLGNEDVVDLFVANKEVNYNLKDKIDGSTTFLSTVVTSNPKLLKILLKKKVVDIQSPTLKGETPLMRAINLGNEEVIKVLLDSGANIAVKNKKGQDALDYAKNQKDYDIMKLVERYSTDPKLLAKSELFRSERKLDVVAIKAKAKLEDSARTAKKKAEADKKAEKAKKEADKKAAKNKTAKKGNKKATGKSSKKEVDKKATGKKAAKKGNKKATGKSSKKEVDKKATGKSSKNDKEAIKAKKDADKKAEKAKKEADKKAKKDADKAKKDADKAKKEADKKAKKDADKAKKEADKKAKKDAKKAKK